MQDSDSEDEDALVFPPSWRRVVHPRRGGLPGPAVKLQPGEWAENGTVFTHGGDRRTLSREIAPMAEGRPSGSTPQEAAALAIRMSGYYDKLWMFVDTWARERGIPFAAAATAGLGQDPSFTVNEARYEAYLRMRRLLAAASEPDYAAAVQALAGLRGNETARIVVSYLVPTEKAWVEEVCATFQPHPGRDVERRMVACTVGSAEQLASAGGPGLLRSYYTSLAEVATITEGLGAAAVPVLLDILDLGSAYTSNESRKAAYAALAHIPTDEAFEALAGRLHEKFVSSCVLEAAERFPMRALRVLAATANGGGTSAPAARNLLAAHVRTHKQRFDDALLRELPEQDARLVSELAEESEGRPDAPAETLPPLLTAPPWTRRAKREAPPVVAGLEPPPLSEVDWAPGEREAWTDKNSWPRKIDYEKLAAQYTSEGFDRGWETRVFFNWAPEHLARPLLPAWKPNLSYWDLVDALGNLVVRFEQDAFPVVLHAAREASPANGGRLLQPIVDLSVARLMADWYTRLKSGRAPAASWFSRHPAAAARLLIPDALGKPGPARRAAEDALRFLAPLTDLRAAAGEYGQQAVTAVERVLAFDPLDRHPQRMPALPVWLDPVHLPQILLRGREYALPAESVRHVVSMLAISKPADPYVGLATVRELAEPSSLAAFAWALFGAWQAMDMPAKEGWILTAQGSLGDDDTARRLAPLIRSWPGQGGHSRAVTGLDVLAEMGTDIALMQLHRISQKVKFKALKSRAQEKVAEIARGLGLTAEQLSDRLVPDFGLDAEGGMWLDYGPRRFRVGFDEQLKPFVTDEAGARRKDLPPANAKDDAELAAAARKHFSALKKDVRAVAAEVIKRLESAMVTGREWSAAEFDELLLGHPLVWHITRRLVWLDGEEKATAFRVAEDRTLATAEDEEHSLAEESRVRLAHPLHLGEGLAAWAEVFADYEILQPFAQLGRPVHALSEQELAEGRLERFEDLTVPVGRVLGLVSRGWQRGTPMDAGVENTISRKIGENLHLIIDLEPGIPVGYIDALGDQTLREVYLSTVKQDFWRGRDEEGPRWGALDAVTASELLADLTHLTNGATR